MLVLDRPRHAQLISEIRAAGARIRMISDGDVRLSGLLLGPLLLLLLLLSGLLSGLSDSAGRLSRCAWRCRSAARLRQPSPRRPWT